MSGARRPGGVGDGPGDPDGRPVWYAAFGSNLASARFCTYLEGGPVPFAAGRVQAGARDPSPPRDDVVVDLPHRLFFARSSRTWSGGGVAFLDSRPSAPWPPPPEPSPSDSTPSDNTPSGSAAGLPVGSTRCRLWLITAGQFADVFAQENGLPTPPAAADLLHRSTAAAPWVLHDERWYGQVVPLGPGPGGHPVLTFTSPTTIAPRAAHPSYLHVVGAGLLEAGGLDPHQAAEYLASRDGNRGVIDPGVLAGELARVVGGPRAPYRPRS